MQSYISKICSCNNNLASGVIPSAFGCDQCLTINSFSATTSHCNILIKGFQNIKHADPNLHYYILTIRFMTRISITYFVFLMLIAYNNQPTSFFLLVFFFFFFVFANRLSNKAFLTFMLICLLFFSLFHHFQDY